MTWAPVQSPNPAVGPMYAAGNGGGAASSGGGSNEPLFSVYRLGNQSMPSASTDNVIMFNTKQFDPSNAFNTTTGKFQPTVAGYYYLTVIARTTAAVSSVVWAGLRKSGGGAGKFIRGTQMTGSSWGVTASGIFYLNGSTDYAEGTFWASSSVTVEGGDGVTTFHGFKLA